jgi:hypothetical protein
VSLGTEAMLLLSYATWGVLATPYLILDRIRTRL